MVSWLWIYFLRFSGLLAWAERKIAASDGTVVLTLHRVLPDPDFQESNSPDGMVMRRQTFSNLLSFLSKNYDVVRLQDGFPPAKKGLTRTRLAVSFDDGWKDTGMVAFPLAVENRIPFTVFVCSDFAGQHSPFWPEQLTRAWRTAANSANQAEEFSVICERGFPTKKFIPSRIGRLDELINCMKTVSSTKRAELVRELVALDPGNASPFSGLEGTMSWEETKTVDGDLCHIGSHGHSHEILTRIPLEQARQEIAVSKKQIAAHLGRECTMFAYPNGSWSNEVREIVLQEGYKKAFINSPGVWTNKTDSMLIPRVNLWENSITNRSGKFSPTVFRYSVFWRAYKTG